MSKQTELTLPVHADAPLARQEPSALQLISAVIDRGITTESVEALGKLCDLKRAMDADAARREFNCAFVALQNELPVIINSKAVVSKGNKLYDFAPYYEIMEIVKPLLKKHGFTLAFDTQRGEGTVTEIGTLIHKEGHEKSSHFTVRIGRGPAIANEAQSDACAATLARRHCLCHILNIVTHSDADARLEGDTETKISDDQAEDLRQRVSALKFTEAQTSAFLRYYKSDNGFEKIPASQYAAASAKLKEREGRA